MLRWFSRLENQIFSHTYLSRHRILDLSDWEDQFSRDDFAWRNFFSARLFFFHFHSTFNFFSFILIDLDQLAGCCFLWNIECSTFTYRTKYSRKWSKSNNRLYQSKESRDYCRTNGEQIERNWSFTHLSSDYKWNLNQIVQIFHYT